MVFETDLLKQLAHHDFMLRLALSTLWVVGSLFSGHDATEPPNIILIIADDLAWDDSTPTDTLRCEHHLQRMAETGMRFDRAMLTIGSCSPSRSSIITGRYPHQTDRTTSLATSKNQTTFVEILKKSSYWTAAAGGGTWSDAIKDRFDRLWEADGSSFQLPQERLPKAMLLSSQRKGEAQSGYGKWIKTLNANRVDPFLWPARWILIDLMMRAPGSTHRFR